MSVLLNLLQKTRPYKIDIFGLQDNFIGNLQSYEDTFLGQVVDPVLEIKDDGTQTFNCKIPKFYLSESPNTKIINPRWQDVENGILAVNTRILKVTIDFEEKGQKVYPFIIDKITNRREGNFAVYKEISCSGLAFAELGKIGYKIELNNTILEQDFLKDDTTLANINYWLDKVFPNEKDENGMVTKWLTPWCYEIRMDWRGYLEEICKTFIDGGTASQIEGHSFYNSRTSKTAGKDDENWLRINAGDSSTLMSPRDSTKIYENPHVSNWTIVNGKLTPISIQSFTEKARYVDCSNSNKYNITQTLAEVFEVFCTYEYTCDSNGYFKKTYYDDNGDLWTGKKVIFFNRAIKIDNPFVLNYERNLNTITRVSDSTELYTKMYVNPVASEVMDTGYVSISNTPSNPLMEDYILNFEYLYSVGSINELQKKEIENFEIKIHKLNKKIIALEEEYNELIVDLNEKEALKAAAEASLASARESLHNYETLRDQEATNVPIIKNKNNPYSLILVPQSNYNTVSGSLKLNGINSASIVGYANNSYESKDTIFTSQNLVLVSSQFSIPSHQDDKWFVVLDEYGYPTTLFTSKNNPVFGKEGKFGSDFNINTGAVIYLQLEYCPKNKYIAVCSKLQNQINKQESIIAQYKIIIGEDDKENIEDWTGLKKQIGENEAARKILYDKKEAEVFRLERLLGPALREGYWQPETYEDPGEGKNDSVSWEEKKQQNNTNFIFDTVPFQEEQLNYYYDDPLNITEEGKKYYSYIDLTGICADITTDNIENFRIKLEIPEYKYQIPDQYTLKAGKYYFLLDGLYYDFETDKDYSTNLSSSTKQIDTLVLHSEKSSGKPYITVHRSHNKDNSNQTQIGEYKDKDIVKLPSTPTNLSIYKGNLTQSFMDMNQYLSSRVLSNDAGFVFSFLKGENDNIIPIALLTSEDIDYERYTSLKGYFLNSQDDSNSNLSITKNTEQYEIVYPRLFLDYKNVNINAESFKLSVTNNSYALTKFDDYDIHLRKGKPYITLKVSSKNTPQYILKEPYNIIYQVSKANEMLYLDAKQVAKDNSKPKYSYEVTVANLPEDLSFVELGQLTHINDYSVDINKEYGYVSGISYKLDEPKSDSITISNYKTKFEDLFSSISAQNEAMKQNQTAYNIAAASFTSNGEVEPTVLQNTLNNNNFAFNFSNTNIHLDDTGGLVLTNTNQYNNGIYGQVALRGGGIFCSNSIDQNGNRIWSTGITPEGINASLVTTGRLDTNLIRIYAGDTLAFQWSSEGLFAYKETTVDGKPTLDEHNFICLNENGLKYVNDGVTQLNLSWEGLLIEGINSHTKLDGDKGLTVYGENREQPLAIFGKKDNEYGMFLLNDSNQVTLKTNNSGNLELWETLLIGNNLQDNNFAGLCGKDDNNYKDSVTNKFIRIWAGSKKAKDAKFTVCEDGIVKAQKIIVPDNGEIEFRKGDSKIILTYDKLNTLIQ